jgi:hypothetical protein
VTVTVEAVQDEVEPPDELDHVVVSGLGERCRDFDEIRVVVEPADRLGSSLGGCSRVAGCLEPECLLL